MSFGSKSLILSWILLCALSASPSLVAKGCIDLKSALQSRLLSKAFNAAFELAGIERQCLNGDTVSQARVIRRLVQSLIYDQYREQGLSLLRTFPPKNSEVAELLIASARLYETMPQMAPWLSGYYSDLRNRFNLPASVFNFEFEEQFYFYSSIYQVRPRQVINLILGVIKSGDKSPSFRAAKLLLSLPIEAVEKVFPKQPVFARYVYSQSNATLLIKALRGTIDIKKSVDEKEFEMILSDWLRTGVVPEKLQALIDEEPKWKRITMSVLRQSYKKNSREYIPQVIQKLGEFDSRWARRTAEKLELEDKLGEPSILELYDLLRAQKNGKATLTRDQFAALANASSSANILEKSLALETHYGYGLVREILIQGKFDAASIEVAIRRSRGQTAEEILAVMGERHPSRKCDHSIVEKPKAKTDRYLAEIEASGS